MKWARYPRTLASHHSEKRMADAIREGTISAYAPERGFEAATRGGLCYIRFNPDAVGHAKVAFDEGYAAGRRDVLNEIHSAVWKVREAFRDIPGWEDGRAQRAG